MLMLHSSCKNDQKIMGDILVDELEMEVRHFDNVLNRENTLGLITAIDFLTYIWKYNLQELYPNMGIVLRVMLTTPVTVAGAERSFSRLKIIKNNLRSSISDARLSGLATIAIEQEVARSLDFDNLVTRFAEAKARKKL